MDKFTHRCIIPDGWMEGNEHTVEISFMDIEYRTVCEVCGDVLFTDSEILAALYEDATEK